ncbi:peptidase C14 caspase catalytic subunit p20 [Anopheles sinensis]|uniref:Peptidase C14 caspase catalytic subunit p20 n=1 Tax=Anopheles sinensis TaxID=74873 RepID=A0A084VD59_ANOSI|nr:peptidase C14 caspase catalytic subunit p20 [Anopheles sinensis]
MAMNEEITIPSDFAWFPSVALDSFSYRHPRGVYVCTAAAAVDGRECNSYK